ncbi:hypothetical protein [Rhizobiales bacterium]|jgi:hypothetical protein|uniref:hypothetical protein n=1 Tax=Rhizobium sp. 11_C7_N12_5 TaxID=3240770 RepID=UPI000DDEAD72
MLIHLFDGLAHGMLLFVLSCGLAVGEPVPQHGPPCRPYLQSAPPTFRIWNHQSHVDDRIHRLPQDLFLRFVRERVNASPEAT